MYKSKDEIIAVNVATSWIRVAIVKFEKNVYDRNTTSEDVVCDGTKITVHCTCRAMTARSLADSTWQMQHSLAVSMSGLNSSRYCCRRPRYSPRCFFPGRSSIPS